MRIFKTKMFHQFTKKEKISDELLLIIAKEMEAGLIDSNLGRGLFKKRIGRIGQGKRASYRSLIAFRAQDRLIFMYGYAKSSVTKSRKEIRIAELKALRQVASILLSINLDEVSIHSQALIEVNDE
ncbi:type II toxin-antitoxin system RelE/ParE family toxin [Algicola sagamiensis]|uniref:type II toxin-antitoxin system RelE/ParE family toxin n=1 Tax=Algicola sagamiensis TaxID=163869 RepID=UPI00039A9517|nr:type II toxin-antitoxin system RelE/ParE family toxin [Algicola sagamiensis]